MTVFAGLTFSGMQLQNGTDTGGLYSGSSTLTTVDTILFDSTASFSKPGDQIMGVYNGVVSGTATLTYQGFYTDAAGSPVYVFRYGNASAGTLAIGPDGNISDPTVAVALDTTDAPPMLDTCFLAGTAIATPNGMVAVERLAVGDMVSVRGDHGTVSRPVVWVGGREVRLSAQAPDESRPVRIRRHAFADEVPVRDLLVTPEHCVLVDGMLVPVRMLVNGVSILIDRTITRFSYHHVELARHAILLAEGLETESYLDTGNRNRFGQSAMVGSSGDGDGPKPRDWSGAAAPLAVDRATIEPIWRRIAARVGAATMAVSREQELSVDLRVRLDDDTELTPCAVDAGRARFLVPAGRRAVRLLSRSSVPAQSIGPFVDDRRRLGVAVSGIVCRDGPHAFHTDAAALSGRGWHALEGDRRWSDGDATIEAPVADRDMMLDVRVVAAMGYVVETEEAGLAAA